MSMFMALSFSASAKSRRGFRAKDPMVDPICLRCWIDSVPGREGASSFWCDWRRGCCSLLSFMMSVLFDWSLIGELFVVFKLLLFLADDRADRFSTRESKTFFAG
eukprot:scaffold31122_cov53-Skeletonema_dohrnii-CCMP3373.AAC.1